MGKITNDESYEHSILVIVSCALLTLVGTAIIMYHVYLVRWDKRNPDSLVNRREMSSSGSGAASNHAAGKSPLQKRTMDETVIWFCTWIAVLGF